MLTFFLELVFFTLLISLLKVNHLLLSTLLTNSVFFFFVLSMYLTFSQMFYSQKPLLYVPTLYNGNMPISPFPQKIFIELMETATTGVECSFNKVLFKQIEGMVKRCSLGPALVNILVRFYKTKLFHSIFKYVPLLC